jgi:xylulokinase
MERREYALGIDSSTQGTTAVLLDIGSHEIACEAKIRYRDDPRLAGFGLMERQPLLPPREEGEADQPALLFLAALDAALADLPASQLGAVRAISVSAQQHGQVWLGRGAQAAFEGLRAEGAGRARGQGLAELFGAAFSSPRAPIWMSSNTSREAAELREAAGGPEAMTSLSGSDSPLRFSGAVLRHRAAAEPEAYAATARIHLLSSFLAGVLAGREDAPIDWGNGAGMSLMDYGECRWSDSLVAAAALGLPGGAGGLLARLPTLVHPQAPVGKVARYFAERYGLPPEALVVAGSGDNPQTKVLADGDLLSLGTSFVLMAEGDRPHRSANAMYDGLGRPFIFGCRTNGSLVWESVRVSHGLRADDFAACESALESVRPGSILRILQSERESFPESPLLDYGARPDFSGDYSGAVDSALGLLWLGSRAFAGAPGATAPRDRVAAGRGLAATGGAASSAGTLRRIAAIWNLPVARIGEAGAAAGAAVSAATALVPEDERQALAARMAARATGRGPLVEPAPADVATYHGEGGYLRRLARTGERLGITGLSA